MQKGLKVSSDNSFENLEQIPKQVIKQVAKLPTDIVGGAVKSVVGQKSDLSQNQGGRKVDPLTGIEIPTPQHVKQLKKQEAKRKQAAIPHAQQIIQGLQKPQGQNIPAYISGKPGFSEGKAVKQMQGLEKHKKELPPPVSASKPKMGTSEIRGGVSG